LLKVSVTATPVYTTLESVRHVSVMYRDVEVTGGGRAAGWPLVKAERAGDAAVGPSSTPK
jgi:hypothetical protein